MDPGFPAAALGGIDRGDISKSVHAEFRDRPVAESSGHGAGSPGRQGILQNPAGQGMRVDRAVTGQPFRRDHAIPFALWHNNDLWNLLPAHPRVNNRKRDCLPEKDLVTHRKDGIIYYWQRLRGAMPARFDAEANRLAGMDLNRERNLETRLFTRFRDAIEYTAIQRSWQRWQPERKSTTEHTEEGNKCS